MTYRNDVMIIPFRILCHVDHLSWMCRVLLTAADITLLDYLFAPKIFLALCTSACQAFEFAIQWTHLHKPRVLFTKLPSPILPLA